MEKISMFMVSPGDKLKTRGMEDMEYTANKPKYVIFKEFVPCIPETPMGLLIHHRSFNEHEIKLPKQFERVIPPQMFMGENQDGIVGTYAVASGWWREKEGVLI